MIKWFLNLFFYNPCATCATGKVPRYSDQKNVLMLQCSDGSDSIEVCDECYKVFDLVEQAYVQRNTF